MKWLDEIPLWLLALGAVGMGLAPFVPEPHLWEKLKLLASGALRQPMDIFDLLMHAALPVLLVVRLWRLWRGGPSRTPS